MSQKTKIQRVTGSEHVLLRPDMYVGSVSSAETFLWLYNPDQGLYYTKANIVPGLCKIFDEIIVNASDNKQRDSDRSAGHKMSYIKCDVDVVSGAISVENDGVEGLLHFDEKEKMYLPTLAFGILMTSSNYDDTEQRVTGGRNGYGAKLTNIFSTKFTVLLQENGRVFEQTWTDNMKNTQSPRIEDVKDKKKNFIRFSFTPDYMKFGMTSGLDRDHAAYMMRRAVDVAGCNIGLKLIINGEELKIANFEQYARMVYRSINPEITQFYEASRGDAAQVGANDSDSEPDLKSAATKAKPKAKRTKKAVETNSLLVPIDELSKPSDWTSDYLKVISVNKFWDIGLGYTDSGELVQVSFVNSINTTDGGTHVDAILDLIMSQLNDILIKSFQQDAKNAKKLTRQQLKSCLVLFIRSLVVNPSFDSQTKISLKTDKAALLRSLGSTQAELTNLATQLVKRIQDVRPLWNALRQASYNQAAKLLTKTDGSKTSQLLGIPKLDDAIAAGTRESSKCTLILTEGDSAKALAVDGISSIEDGKKYYGVFPLRGKVINVRNESIDKVSNNAEITNLKKILGLKQGMDYSTQEARNTLRYGHVMIMTDQDPDGSHIKGLLINLFDTYWNGLARSNKFLDFFITPIVRCTQARNMKTFYTIPEYKKWTQTVTDLPKWNINYYKGLGSSNTTDAKQYFQQIANNRKTLIYNPESASKLKLAFDKKLADDRKTWISGTDPDTYLDLSPTKIDITAFVDKELVLYDIESNQRAIPSLMDGLKPGQRKVLYACFKRNLKSKLKVSQLSGYVSDKAAYHHGEASLNGTIVNMAQSFTGSNNIALLYPAGIFGSRARGGKDSSAPRYISTYLDPLARYLFPEPDDAIMQYKEDDGKVIEPFYYAPILPMVLINGSDGIGTGFSTTIPQFDPLDMLHSIRLRIYGKTTRNEKRNLKPFSNGWKGTMTHEYDKSGKFVRWRMTGCFSVVDLKTIQITDLPIGVWTESYREEIETWIKGNEEAGAVKKPAAKVASTAKGKPKLKGAPSAAKEKATTKDQLYDSVTGYYKGIHPALMKVIDMSDNNTVNIIVTLSDECARYLIGTSDADIKSCNTVRTARYDNIVKGFKLDGSIRPSNMWLYNERNMLCLYHTPFKIIDAFYTKRLALYGVRRNNQLIDMDDKSLMLNEKARFIKLIIEDKLNIKNVPRDSVTEILWNKYQFHPSRKHRIILLSHRNLINKKQTLRVDDDSERPEEEDDADQRDLEKHLEATVKDLVGAQFFNAINSWNGFTVQDRNECYEYLLRMPISTMTKESYKNLQSSAELIKAEAEKLRNTTVENIWLRDLAAFEAAYEVDRHMEQTKSAETRRLTVTETMIQGKLKEAEHKYTAMPSRTGDSDNEIEYSTTRDDQGLKIKGEPKPKKERVSKTTPASKADTKRPGEGSETASVEPTRKKPTAISVDTKKASAKRGKKAESSFTKSETSATELGSSVLGEDYSYLEYSYDEENGSEDDDL